MGRLDKILEDIANDGGEKEKTTPQPEPAVEEPEKDDVPPDDEPERRDEPPKDEPPKAAQPAGDEPNPEGQPHDEPPKDKKDIPDDPMKRAEFSFKRQLGKQKDKYEKELAEKDKKLAEFEKKLADIEKKMAPKDPVKGRDDFENDDDYIKYLTDMKVKAILAERDEAEAKKQAERDEEARKKEAEQAELRAKQEEWIGHVHEAFGGDKARSDKFLEKVAYANGHGLGQVLDNCPVAADYLINDPMGPLVFEKILTDRPTFERVFDPRRTSPLAVYHELRVVEDSIKAELQAPGGQPAQPKANVVPAMGRPGKQAGSSSLASTDMFDDPKALRKWMREHR